ncbi:MHS family MFS transporter [Amycolatopsis acidicola]|uniref:MHS family MFS transporter n=1 Tax=Amycolatopsis acidicola TaxID=2596893 RepID=A0A5N0UNL9_9PSEU|nr:MFS transporter [Amycolatopsis acidicola]KAA9149017.1 MHS family MFS transporter [Amycolatopsis acidicola]
MPETARASSLGGKPLSPARIATSSMIGTMVEIFDFIVYAFMAALVFAPLFFPAVSPWIGTLAALGTHAVAFGMRPLGALLFGWIGDTRGRRVALLGSMVLMGVATVAIGALPTFATAGLWAPVLLVVFRMLQGLAVGGEWGGAVLVAVEHAPKRRRSLYGSFVQLGTVLGIGVASAVILLVNTAVSAHTFQAWAWRVPFLASALLVVLGVVLRKRLEETPEFVAELAAHEAETGARPKVRTVFRDDWRALIAGSLMWSAPCSFLYVLMTGLVAYTKAYVPGLSSTDVQLGLLVTSVVLAGLTVFFAVRADSWGRERLVLWSGALLIVWAFPAFRLIDTGGFGPMLIAMLVGSVCYAAFNGAVPSLMADLFPVASRYTGCGLCIAFGTAVAGGIVPIGGLALAGEFGGSSVPLSLTLVLCGVLTVAGVGMSRRRPAMAGHPTARHSRTV